MLKFRSIIHAIIIVLMNVIAKLPLAFIMLVFLNVRYKNLRELFSTRGPFLVLPNHTNQWDPFILSFIVPKPIHWVASDGAFRDTILKPFMLLGGAIPKIKEQSDLATLHGVKKATAMKHTTGIFPEGEQTWDGRSIQLIPATAKLIRHLKLPVLVPLIKGGYLTKPRWAWGIRRCRIEVHFKRLINSDEIKTMKLSEIKQRLNDALFQDDYEWQKKTLAPIKGNRRAEHLELALYTCPGCERIGTLTSKNNDLKCQCGYEVHIDSYGFFNFPAEGPTFNAPNDWMKWQNKLLISRIQRTIESANNDSDPVLMRDSSISLMKSRRAMPMQSIHHGEARLYENRIEVGEIGSRIETFPLKEISAVTTFKQQKFEFRFKQNQYRFAMPTRNISGYKWEIAVKGLCQ